MSDDRRDPIEVDDEITTDVDPDWIAALRVGITDPADAGPADDEPAVAGTTDADDWTNVEPPWDPEATVGASSGLIERIRQEMTTPPAPAPPAPAAPAAPASEGPRQPPPPVVAAPAVPPPIAPPPIVPPSGDAPASGDRDVSTTVRWEPQQRLSTAAPIAESAVIAPPTHVRLDHTKLAIAIVAAVTLIVIAWLVLGSRGGNTVSPPVDSVPASGVESTVPNSESSG